MRRQAGFQLLEAAEWSKRLREAAPAGDLQAAADGLSQSFGLMKATIFDVRKASDDKESRVLEFTISTSSVDRDFDSINAKGWDLKAYRKNPVVLWAHDSYNPPIARAPKLWIEEDKLNSQAEFMPFEMYPFSDMVFNMLNGGFLRTASVGFRPLKVTPAEEEERRQRYGVDFDKQELLEWSVVPVPANPEALMRAHAAGINTRPLKAWAEQVLDLRTPLPGLGLNDVEAAWKAVKGPDRLIVWVETEGAAASEPAPVVAPVVVDPKAADPAAPVPPAGARFMTLEELARYDSLGIVFRRRAEGDYEVLRNGDPVLVVENPNAVEWDAAGVLRLAETPDPEALLLDLEDEPALVVDPPAEIPAVADGDVLVEMPAEPTPAAEPTADDALNAFAAALLAKMRDMLAPGQPTQ